MKTFMLVAASGLAMSLAGCGGKPAAMRTTLDCPKTQGELTRTGIAADGKACTYVTAAGAEVTLQLISAPQGPDAALSVIETTLLANRQAPKPKSASDKEAAKAADKASSPAKEPAEPAVKGSAERAAREAAEDSRRPGVDVTAKSDTSGVVKDDGNGTATINLPGIHIVANERDETANIRVGPLSVNAADNTATIRMRRDVRLRGEALSPTKRGVRATFIYTGEDLPEGYRFVGYEAGGPKTGPLTVAVVKSKQEEDVGSEIYPDVKRLVRRNGGV